MSAPVEDETVYLAGTGYSATSGAGGAYTISNVPAGTYTVDSYSTSQVYSDSVEVAAGASPFLLDTRDNVGLEMKKIFCKSKSST